MRVCKKCNVQKHLCEFKKAKTCKNGISHTCLDCAKSARKRHYKENREATLEVNAKWAYANKEKRKEDRKLHYQQNKEKALAQGATWYKKNKEKRIKKSNAYTKARRSRDVSFRISHILRARLYNALRSKHKTGSAVQDLGCSVQELLQMFDEQCLARYGERYSEALPGKYHIDHIRPLASFDLMDPAQLRIAVHFSNLQILEAKENLQKGARS